MTTTEKPPAIESLVATYVDLVYSAALRQLRDPHLADDVTQAVFLVLVQKIDRLPPAPLIAPWLLKVTRYTAITSLRAHRRLKRRESLAATPSLAPAPDAQDHEAELLALLDEALMSLAESDRTLITLRYLQNQPVVDIAAALNLRANTVAKKLQRALEKLRAYFQRKHIPTTPSSLSAFLAASTVPAPKLLLPKILASAATFPTSLAVTTKGTLLFMTISKLQTAALIAAACLLIAVPTYLLILHHGAPTPPPSLVATPPSPPTTTPASPSPTTAGSPDAFAQAYSLPHGQIVRRITDAPPEIRDPFVHKTFQTAPFSRGAILIGWAGAAMSNTSYWAAAPSYPLSFLAQQMFNIPPTEIEGDLLQRTITGDFVYDQSPTVTPAQRCAALQKILTDELDLPAQIQFRNVPRKIIILHGHWNLTPLPNSPALTAFAGGAPIPCLCIYRDDQFDPQSQSNFSTTAPSSVLVSQLTSYLHQQVLIEADGLPAIIAYCVQSSRSTRRPVKFTSEIRDQILQHLTEQTTLTWTEETRTVPRLFLESPPTP